MNPSSTEPVRPAPTPPGAADPAAATHDGGPPASRRRTRWMLLALVAVCVAPVIASYLTYYAFPPDGRTNYGQLVEPQRDLMPLPVVPRLVAGSPNREPLQAEPGVATTLAPWRGRWLFVVASGAACDAACEERLYKIRQVRLTTGKDRDRIERLWLLTDDGAPDPSLLKAHEGISLLQIAPADLLRELPGAADADPLAHIYLVDPFGHLMMRFPIGADPSRMKKDMIKLLKASRIG